MRRRLGGAAVAAGLAAALAVRAAAQQQPLFRASTVYVELDVVVTDGQGRAVKNLTADDFQVLEHGRRQKLDNFKFVDVPPVHRTIAVKTAAPTVDVVTNAHAPLARQWVLVVDDLHIFEQRIVETQRVIQDFLESLPATDQVAIVFTGRSDLSQDFTSDLGAQVRTVNRIRDAVGFASDTPSTMGTAGFRIKCAERLDHARGTLMVLDNIETSLLRSTFPRKAVVFVSQGFDFDVGGGGADACGGIDGGPQAVIEALEQTFARAKAGGVPIYTIDPRGNVGPEDATRHGDPDTGALVNELNFMHTVADNTGGLAFVRRNMTGAMQELVEDNDSYYLLGYYPDPLVRDGKFHDVTVHVTNPKLHVRARPGYTAPAAADAPPASATTTLNDALGDALDGGDIDLRAFAAPIAPTPHGMKTAVTVEVDYPLPPGQSTIHDTLHVGLVAVDHDGKIKDSHERAFQFTASASGRTDAHYTINDTLDLPSEPLTLRVAVESEALGKVGTVHVPVEIIKPSKDELQMSAVVIGDDAGAREAAVPPGALKDLLPFQPTTTRAFAATDTLHLFAPLFWKSAPETAAVHVALRAASSDAAHADTTVDAPAGADGHHRGDADLLVPLSGLAPGPYVLTITASLSNGSTATRDVAVTIK